MAMYNTDLKTFRILDLDTATVVVNIDFGALDRMPEVSDTTQGLSLHAGSWSSGHFVFLKNLRQPHNGRDSFQGQGWQMSDFKKKEWASFFWPKVFFWFIAALHKTAFSKGKNVNRNGPRPQPAFTIFLTPVFSHCTMQCCGPGMFIRILIFTPDPDFFLSRIQKQQQKRGVKKLFMHLGA